MVSHDTSRSRNLRRPGISLVFVAWGWIVGLAASVGPAAKPACGQAERDWSQTQLLLCFQGKGSCLPYDAGVLHELYARIPALRTQPVIIAGNSSGSIPAGYFCCHGLSDATVRYAEHRFVHGDVEAIRQMENPYSKVVKLLRGQATEIPHTDLREYIAFALGVTEWRSARSIPEIVGRSKVRPRHPALIVACNKEVLEDRCADDWFAPRGYKEIDLDTLIVSWRPEVYDFYLRHPEKFSQDHPDLKLGSDRTIGRAVTYFVDPALYDLLRRIPAQERTADLRLMTTAEDVATALLASLSEPTYFAPVVELQPEKVLTGAESGALGNVRRRSYYGGYIVPMPAQEIRRMLPAIRVLGTGWMHNPHPSRSLLRTWLLADCEEIAQRTDWWTDLAVYPDAEFQSHATFRDLSSKQEYDYGRRLAASCLAGQGGVPLFATRPRFCYPVDGAIVPSDPPADMYSGESLPDGRPILRTMRGLGTLLPPPAAAQ